MTIFCVGVAREVGKTGITMHAPGATELRYSGSTLATLMMISSSRMIDVQKRNVLVSTTCSTPKIPEKLLNRQVRNNLKSPPRGYSKTKYKGVIYRGSDYYVRVWTLDPPFKKYVGGVFKDPVEAAKYYDQYMIENVGDWVYLNFRNPNPECEIEKAPEGDLRRMQQISDQNLA